jgi:hypothetical protein
MKVVRLFVLVLLCALACLLSALVLQAAGKRLHCAQCTSAFSADSPTRFTITRQHGKVLYGCCAHCGLLLVSRLDDVTAVTTRDANSGKGLDATTAYYVANPKAHCCCCESTLAFATREDAEQYQQQHGGTVFSYEDALRDVSGKKGK